MTSFLTIKWPNLVVKCTAQVQTRDLLNRITSNFDKWSYIKKTKKSQIKIIKFGFWLQLWRHFWLKNDQFFLKCASRVQTWDLQLRITSKFDKMIFHIKVFDKLKKYYRIWFLTATVTSLLTQKWPLWHWNALLESKLEIYLSESLQILAKWSPI